MILFAVFFYIRYTVSYRDLEEIMAIGDKLLVAQGWGRLPAGTDLIAITGSDGAQVWIKDAPLQHSDVLQIPS